MRFVCTDDTDSHRQPSSVHSLLSHVKSVNGSGYRKVNPRFPSIFSLCSLVEGKTLRRTPWHWNFFNRISLFPWFLFKIDSISLSSLQFTFNWDTMKWGASFKLPYRNCSNHRSHYLTCIPYQTLLHLQTFSISAVFSGNCCSLFFTSFTINVFLKL